MHTLFICMTFSILFLLGLAIGFGVGLWRRDEKDSQTKENLEEAIERVRNINPNPDNPQKE